MFGHFLTLCMKGFTPEVKKYVFIETFSNFIGSPFQKYAYYTCALEPTKARSITLTGKFLSDKIFHIQRKNRRFCYTKIFLLLLKLNLYS